MKIGDLYEHRSVFGPQGNDLPDEFEIVALTKTHVHVVQTGADQTLPSQFDNATFKAEFKPIVRGGRKPRVARAARKPRAARK
jgi:hypothetical protein